MLHGNNPDHTLTLKTIFLAIITYYYVTYYSQCAGNCVGGCGGGSCYPGDVLFDYSLLRRWYRVSWSGFETFPALPTPSALVNMTQMKKELIRGFKNHVDWLLPHSTTSRPSLVQSSTVRICLLCTVTNSCYSRPMTHCYDSL